VASSLRSTLYRYLFYGWLFGDARAGSDLERALVLRHNRANARWLPVYMRRWLAIGVLLTLLEILSERMLEQPLLTAGFAVAQVLVVLFLFVTAVCWAFLRGRRSGR
jgi:hypothetical protein